MLYQESPGAGGPRLTDDQLRKLKVIASGRRTNAAGHIANLPRQRFINLAREVLVELGVDWTGVLDV